MQLTPEHRERLYAEMSALPSAEKRVEHIAALRRIPGRAWEVSVLEGIHGKLLKIEREKEHGNTRVSRSVVRYELNVNFAGFTAGNRKEFVVRAVVLLGGPALVAVILLNHALIGMVITWTLGAVVVGGFGFFFLKMLFSGWRSPSESPKEKSGNQYHYHYYQNHYHENAR